MRHHLPGDLNRSVKAAPAWLFESIPDVGPPIIIPFPFLKLEVEKSSEYLDLLEAPGIKVKPKLIDLLIPKSCNFTFRLYFSCFLTGIVLNKF